MIHYIRENIFAVMLTVISVLLVAGLLMAGYNRHVMIENTALKQQTEMVKQEFGSIFGNTLRLIDLGLRGYALTKSDGLLNPFNNALRDNETNLRRIDSLLTVQGLDTTKAQFAAFKTKLYAYLEHSKHMKQLAEEDNMDEFVRLLNMDKGFDLWQAFAPINASVMAYEDSLIAQSQRNYERAMNRNVIFQALLVLIGIPSLLFVMSRIRREASQRSALLKQFEESNWQYLFNPGNTEERKVDATLIISESITNLKEASNFIKHITQGNYGVTWTGMSAQNEALNKENLAGHLQRMRDEMKRVKQEDQQRLWATEGLAQFSELVRNNQNSVTALCDGVVRFLTQYLKAQQGSLFVIEKDDDGTEYLALTACFAFEKKKYVEKRIELGSGILGQACLEGSSVLLKEIPSGYVHITSGLGEATPTNLLIVPMKYNDKVECMYEVASFRSFEAHEVAFLEKAGEFVASSIFNVKSNEHTTSLLRAAQENTEMLRSQEEEMRQNMEELQATQEEMARKESESSRILEECRENEKVLQSRLRQIEEKYERELAKVNARS
jgi:CHASE3 domain sensor protein